ncbi:MAG: TRAP transporter fused permease subunit [Pseudomonadota bacterium]|nr:TRAP transporter fused permease subunit [Pseudomonadota bacterium]
MTSFLKMLSPRTIALTLVSSLFVAFHLWVLLIYPIPGHQLRAVHLGFALTLVFLYAAFEVKEDDPRWRGHVRRLVNVALIAASVASMAYIYLNYFDLIRRAGRATDLDIYIGIAALAVTIEAARRTTGWALPLIAIVFILYALVGGYFPEPFNHRGISLSRLVYMQYLTMDGLFGAPLGAAASVVFFFLVFAAFLQETKIGDFYISLANGMVGARRGGAAKVAAVGSGFLGSVSGSAVANVVTSGVFTIPMMKRTGYSTSFAGGVEAVASTGGQLMPPVMGAAAFVMADMMGIPYSQIVLAAIIPALLYYVSLLITIDLEAARLGISGVPKSSQSKLRVVLRADWYLLLPIGVLLAGLLYFGWSPSLSAILATASILVIAVVVPKNRIGFSGFFAAIRSAGKDALVIAAATAAAGIIIGVMSVTGLGMRLSSILIDLAGDNLLLLLFLTMIASIVLGMGLPTTAAYVMLAVLVAPALVDMGVTPLAAHFFVLYFGILSSITPPVALASFAAATMSGGSPMKTSFAAVKIGLIAYIIPFVFVVHPEFLLIGATPWLALKLVTALVGLYALGGAVSGFAYGRVLGWPLRAVLAGASICLILPGLWTDLVGLIVSAAFLGAAIRSREGVKAEAGSA